MSLLWLQWLNLPIFGIIVFNAGILWQKVNSISRRLERIENRLNNIYSIDE